MAKVKLCIIAVREGSSAEHHLKLAKRLRRMDDEYPEPQNIREHVREWVYGQLMARFSVLNGL